MNRLLKIYDTIISKCVSLLYIMIILSGFAQVVTRYVFSFSIVWVEELSKYIFVWLTFLAASAGVLSKSHIRTDFLVEKLPDKMKKYSYLSSDMLSFLYMGIFTYLVTKLMAIAKTDISSTLGIPLSYVYLGMFLGSFFITINIVRVIAGDIRTSMGKMRSGTSSGDKL